MLFLVGGLKGSGGETGWDPEMERARSFLDPREEDYERSSDTRAEGETSRNSQELVSETKGA